MKENYKSFQHVRVGVATVTIRIFFFLLLTVSQPTNGEH